MKKSKKLLTFAASLFALTVAVSCGGGGTSSGTPTSTDTPVSEPAVSEPVSEPEGSREGSCSYRQTDCSCSQ